MSVAELIENERQRSRSNSIPIISGMDIEPLNVRPVAMKDREANNKRDREIDHQVVDLEPANRSPEAKRDKREIEKMTSWKDCNAEKELISVTMVINYLISNCKNSNVKSLIDCYNPLIREETDLLKKHILACCENWDNKEESIREAIRHVWPEIDIDIDTINDKDELTDVLLISLETLMPKQCKECDDFYIVNRGNKNIIRCMWCKGGAHDCIDRGNKEKLTGMFWLCKSCNFIMNKHILPKISLEKKMEIANKETEINFKGFENKKAEEPEVKTKIEDRDSGKIGTAKGENKEPIREGNGNSDGGDKRKEETDPRSDNGERNNSRRNDGERNNEKKICWFYENRNCKFGNQCRNAHPKACQQMIEYGRCNDNKCTLIHPKICRLFTEQGMCRRINCWFTHPSKINNGNQNGTFADMPQRSMQESGPNIRRAAYQQPSQNFNFNPNNQNANSNFLGNWPTPAEATSMRIHQTLTRVIGAVEKIDDRMGKWK